jgi:predicted ATPase
MPKITTVTVRRFKQLQDLTLTLGDDVTVLVGANNAGKSSFLQALHLAASVAQTVRLVAEGVTWGKDVFQTTVSPEQLIYSPVSDVLTLATGGRLEEAANTRIEIELHADDGSVTVVGLKRGRNRNLAVSVEGRGLGELLMDFEHPFTIYAPGLAGVPKSERYLSAGVVRRIVARGDANLALRNVLRMLKNSPESWTQYIEDMRKFFPGIDIDVDFKDNTDEFVNVFFRLKNGSKLPFDSAGTSILQASQILAYVNLFHPQILILDEPDSHLHPDNQRKLCSLVADAASSRGFQAIISTHSRHVLDALSTRATIVWLNKGVQQPATDLNTTSMLLDLGALDSADYFADGALRSVIVTEDTETTGLEALLWSSGFIEDQTEVASYAGASKIEAARVLGQFLSTRAPNLQVIIHRDSDYMPEDKKAEITSEMSAAGISFFATEGSDVEDYFLNPEHLHHLNAELSADQIGVLIEQATNECAADSIEALINQRILWAQAAKKVARDQINHGNIAVTAQSDYTADPTKYRRGKIVLKRVISLMQSAIHKNPRVFFTSPFLNSPLLKSIASAVPVPAVEVSELALANPNPASEALQIPVVDELMQPAATPPQAIFDIATLLRSQEEVKPSSGE